MLGTWAYRNVTRPLGVGMLLGGSIASVITTAPMLVSALRSIRQQQGLSLHGVEEKSQGRWKAVVVGSYERGDRAVVAIIARAWQRREVLAMIQASLGLGTAQAGLVTTLPLLAFALPLQGTAAAAMVLCGAHHHERVDVAAVNTADAVAAVAAVAAPSQVSHREHGLAVPAGAHGHADPPAKTGAVRRTFSQPRFATAFWDTSGTDSPANATGTSSGAGCKPGAPMVTRRCSTRQASAGPRNMADVQPASLPAAMSSVQRPKACMASRQRLRSPSVAGFWSASQVLSTCSIDQAPSPNSVSPTMRELPLSVWNARRKVVSSLVLTGS